MLVGTSGCTYLLGGGWHKAGGGGFEPFQPPNWEFTRKFHPLSAPCTRGFGRTGTGCAQIAWYTDWTRGAHKLLSTWTEYTSCYCAHQLIIQVDTLLGVAGDMALQILLYFRSHSHPPN